MKGRKQKILTKVMNSVMTKEIEQKQSPAGNRRLAQWRVTWLIEHSTSHQLLWCIDSFVFRNPPLRQAPKRYPQCLKKVDDNR